MHYDYATISAKLTFAETALKDLGNAQVQSNPGLLARVEKLKEIIDNFYLGLKENV